MRIDCHVPITVRIVGVPTDDQLVALGKALAGAVTARLAEADCVLAERHGHARDGVTVVREPYDRSRDGESGYAVPSYLLAGDPVAVPAGPTVPAGTAPPAPPAQPVLPDLDANEARALAERSLATLVDEKAPATQNEAAVRAIALDVFGSREAVDAVFATLSQLVQQEVDSQHGQADPDAKTAHRLQFFIRMRLYFPSWQELLNHFRNFRRVQRRAVGDSPEVDVVLHGDAADRLERVLNLLPKHPRISVGFQLRHYEEGEIQTQGYMIHALGFAIDIAAAENPKIATQSSGARRFDPHQVASAIDPGSAYIPMGNDWPGIVKAMGQRMAADTRTLAGTDEDPTAKRVFALFEQRFRAMQQGSRGFAGSLSADHRTKLLDVRKRYVALLREIEARRRNRSDAQALAELQARRAAILAEIPPLVTEWRTALDREIAGSIAKHPGMDRLRPPTEIRAELRNIERAVEDEQRAKAATAAAERRRDAAVAKVRQAGRDWTPGSAETLRDMEAKRQEANAALRAEIRARRVRDEAVAGRDSLKAELAKSDIPELRDAWNWIAEVAQLRTELARPDLSTTAGLATFEALMTGDLQHLAPADNPPLLQLLDVGFFNPKGGFDLGFFEEMAHSGFVPGATWRFPGTDPMHFELQEGRERIRLPGTLPPRGH